MLLLEVVGTLINAHLCVDNNGKLTTLGRTGYPRSQAPYRSAAALQSEIQRPFFPQYGACNLANTRVVRNMTFQ